MSILDVVTVGYIGIAVWQAKNPRKSARELFEETGMGVAGGLVGAILATRIFGVALPVSNIALAAAGLILLFFVTTFTSMFSDWYAKKRGGGEVWTS